MNSSENSSVRTFTLSLPRRKVGEKKICIERTTDNRRNSLDGLVNGFDQFIVDLSRPTFATPTGRWCCFRSGRRNNRACWFYKWVVDRGGHLYYLCRFPGRIRTLHDHGPTDRTKTPRAPERCTTCTRGVVQCRKKEGLQTPRGKPARKRCSSLPCQQGGVAA